MNSKINITKSDGMAVSADLICYFQTGDNKYVYYTLNEMGGDATNSTVKVYVGKVKTDNPAVDVPITEEEWGKLKNHMGEVLKDTVNDMSYLPAPESVTTVSEKVIAMPTSYDYVNKHRSVYEEAVKNAPVQEMPTPAVETQPAVEEGVPEVSPFAVPQADPIENSEPEVKAPSFGVPEVPAPEGPIIPAPEAPAEDTTINPFAVPEPEQEKPLPKLDEAPAPVDPMSGFNIPTEESGNDKAINIDEIDKKYDDMIRDIEDLRKREKEAAERYNATLKLTEMHTEQHAASIAADMGNSVEPAIPEPTPVTPVVPEAPAAPTNDVETNWFDMPQQ